MKTTTIEAVADSLKDKTSSARKQNRVLKPEQEKLNLAYHWITHNAIISPTYDIEYGDIVSNQTNQAGNTFPIRDGESYNSFVLLSLLNLMTCSRAVTIGGPGRAKTSIAILMSGLAGIDSDTIRKSIVRGHPQLTSSDLLGAPLPSSMMSAQTPEQIQVSWNSWIPLRNKIIDEYNRIPTKSQSPMLPVMAEGYATQFNQYAYTGKSSWFLTANYDSGGGTFEVIEALKDRIDIVIRAGSFNPYYIEHLLARIESDKSPSDYLPEELVFSEEELEKIYKDILSVPVDADALKILSSFMAQLDFCRLASLDFHSMSKDILRMSGKAVGDVCNEACPLDKKLHVCSQTENGVSARAYQSLLKFSKAIAYFRGVGKVSLEDIHQILPFILHDKLIPNARSQYFTMSDTKANKLMLQDKIHWIKSMFETTMEQYPKYEKYRDELESLMDDKGGDYHTKLNRIKKYLDELILKAELSAPIYQIMVELKALWSKYQNIAGRV